MGARPRNGAVTGLVERVSHRLTEDGLRLAIAESCTGGLLAVRLTDRAGASRFLAAAFVTYSDESKSRLLGVRRETLAEHGAVSEAVASEMVAGAREAIGAESGVAITGIAGPDGGTPEKPVGTVWIATSVLDRREVRHHRFPGGRSEIREQAVRAALEALDRLLGGPS